MRQQWESAWRCPHHPLLLCHQLKQHLIFVRLEHPFKNKLWCNPPVYKCDVLWWQMHGIPDFHPGIQLRNDGQYFFKMQYWNACVKFLLSPKQVQQEKSRKLNSWTLMRVISSAVWLIEVSCSQCQNNFSKPLMKKKVMTSCLPTSCKIHVEDFRKWQTFHSCETGFTDYWTNTVP